MNRIPEYIAMHIYDILVHFAGASNTDDGRSSFLHYYCRGDGYRPTEYRCCGKFGFAGKFWWNNDRFYVSGHSRGDVSTGGCTQERLDNEASELDHINGLLADAYREFEKYRERDGILSAIPAFPQHQGALMDQLRLLIPVANKLGLQDAADFIQRAARGDAG